MSPAGPATVFLCGPRVGGNSDTAGLAFASGLARAGIEPRIIRLREHKVHPCRGCGACALGPAHGCPLSGDEAEFLFEIIREASVLAFAAPIYFYHLPAQFKALIDRAQRHYAVRLDREQSGGPAPAERVVEVLLVAGRREGRQLFTGSLLTLRYFLWPFDARPTENPCLLRGYDGPDDLAGDSATLEALAVRGQAAAGTVPGLRRLGEPDPV